MLAKLNAVYGGPGAALGSKYLHQQTEAGATLEKELRLRIHDAVADFVQLGEQLAVERVYVLAEAFVLERDELELVGNAELPVLENGAGHDLHGDPAEAVAIGARGQHVPD